MDLGRLISKLLSLSLVSTLPLLVHNPRPRGRGGLRTPPSHHSYDPHHPSSSIQHQLSQSSKMPSNYEWREYIFVGIASQYCSNEDHVDVLMDLYLKPYDVGAKPLWNLVMFEHEQPTCQTQRLCTLDLQFAIGVPVLMLPFIKLYGSHGALIVGLIEIMPSDIKSDTLGGLGVSVVRLENI